MANLKQIQASRNNGSKSRGAVTPEGKARPALNSVKHGIYSKSIVVNNEDPEAYAAILAEFLHDCAPVGIQETRLVTDIVNANWRIDRLGAFETAALDLETDRLRTEIDAAFDEIDEPTRATLAFNSLISNNRTYEVIQAGMRNQHRIRDRASAQLARLQKERRKNEPNPEPPATSQAATAPPAPSPAPDAPKRTTPAQPVNIENHRNKPNTATIPANNPQSSPASPPPARPENQQEGEK